MRWWSSPAHHPVVFPIHPRTRANLERFNMLDKLTSTATMKCLEPLNYVRFMNLVFNCRLVVTDSGGIQEETTYLGIPCITLRDNTERPITVTEGTNRLCTLENLGDEIDSALTTKRGKTNPPHFWDGKTASRVADRIYTFLSGSVN